MRLIPCLVLFTFFLPSLYAQQVPKAEIFAGYSFARTDFAIPPQSSRANLHGWNISVTVPLNRWFGLTTDFSGHYLGSATSQFDIPTFCPPLVVCQATAQEDFSFRAHSFLFGPQFKMRKEKLAPYAHFLLGVTRLDSTMISKVIYSPPGATILLYPSSFSTSVSSATAVMGGGADYRITDRFSWRTGVDYWATGFGSSSRNNLRVSTGLVIHLGKGR